MTGKLKTAIILAYSDPDHRCAAQITAGIAAVLVTAVTLITAQIAPHPAIVATATVVACLACLVGICALVSWAARRRHTIPGAAPGRHHSTQRRPR